MEYITYFVSCYTYLDMHAQYFALININLELQIFAKA